MPRRSVSPGARSLTMVCSWARLVVSARAPSRNARARRRISAARSDRTFRAADRGRRREHLPLRPQPDRGPTALRRDRRVPSQRSHVFKALIPQVLDDLDALHPSVIVPTQCTGWRAQHAIAGRFGEAFVLNTVGTRFAL